MNNRMEYTKLNYGAMLPSLGCGTWKSQRNEVMEYTKLNNGAILPILGFGTWKSQPNEVKNAVVNAIKVGYRHIDCAHMYGNENEVGDAINECINSGLCTREDLFITSKLWNDSHDPDDVIKAIDYTLNQLKLDYLDMYLIHWPVVQKKSAEGLDDYIPLSELPITKTWVGMEQCVKLGKTRGIGVSNFSIKKLEDLLASCEIPPAINQVERHPYLSQTKLIEFCSAKNIHVTGYSGLGSMDRPDFLKAADEPVLLQDPIITDIAKKYQASPAQILLRWAIDTGSSTIPKSVHASRIQENYNSLNIHLSNTDIEKINGLNKDRRYLNGSFWCSPGNSYTLENLWDE